MPVVRELVNRISFKVNPADKKNANDAISKMDRSIKGLLSTAKKLGAILAGAFVAGGVQLTKFEKSTAKISFFARTKKEAEELKTLFAELAEESDIISRRQAQEAGSIISQLNIGLKQVKELAPILAKIDLARTDLSFKETLDAFNAAARGEITAFEQLIPGFKDIAEKLSKGRFGAPFADITQEQRTTLFLEEVKKKYGTILELGKEARKTLTNEVDKLQESASDVSLEFGEKTAEPMKEAVRLANDLVESLQKSKGFWELIKITSESITTALRFLRGVDEKGNVVESSYEKFQKRFLKSERDKLDKLEKDRMAKPALQGTGENFEGTLTTGDTSLSADAARFFEQLSISTIVSTLKKGLTPNLEGANKAAQQLNVNGEIILKNESGETVGVLSGDTVKQLEDKIKSSLNNISASNGAVVGVQ